MQKIKFLETEDVRVTGVAASPGQSQLKKRCRAPLRNGTCECKRKAEIAGMCLRHYQQYYCFDSRRVTRNKRPARK